MLYQNKYDVIIIDEPQLSLPTVLEIRKQNPNSKFIYFSALPPKAIYDLCQFRIEKLLGDLVKNCFLKTTNFWSLDINSTEDWSKSETYRDKNMWGVIVDHAIAQMRRSGGVMMIKCGGVSTVVKILDIC